jgi:hypothetical protein
MIIDLCTAGPDALVAQATPLERLYRDCFAAAPWCEPEPKLAGYPQRLAGQLGRPGAGGLLAYAGATLVGAVYGWTEAAQYSLDGVPQLLCTWTRGSAAVPA